MQLQHPSNYTHKNRREVVVHEINDNLKQNKNYKNSGKIKQLCL